MANNIISIKNLDKSYGNVHALKKLSLEIPRGEIFGIVGPDGAGKTTLIRILAGVIGYDSGNISIMGIDPKSGLDKIRVDLGYISQNFSLYGDLTVEENIDFFMEIFPPDKNANENKQKLLDFIGLAPFTGRLADNLSGGMKQKLSLLCCLIHNPKLLLMDEPTTGVDPVSRREFWSIVFQLQKQGLTVFASTPYMDEAEQFDRVALIHKGNFLRLGTVEEIRDSIPGKVLEVFCNKPFQARQALKKVPHVQDVELFGDMIHVFVDEFDKKLIDEISKNLLSAGIEPKSISPVPYSIEDVFLKITADEECCKEAVVE